MTQHENKSYRSTLGRAKGLGAAKEGVHHWWMQRVTSVALLLPLLYLVWQLPQMVTSDHAMLLSWIRMPLNGLSLLALIIVGFYHAALGIQVVIEDYVHHEGCKLTSLIANKAFFFFVGLACVYAVVLLTLSNNG